MSEMTGGDQMGVSVAGNGAKAPRTPHAVVIAPGEGEESPRVAAHGAGRALESEGVPEILARLRRAHGQLGGVIAMIENERSCQDVVTQLSAVAKAVQRAGFAVVSQAMQQCLTDPQSNDVDLAAMEKLFLRLA